MAKLNVSPATQFIIWRLKPRLINSFSSTTQISQLSLSTELMIVIRHRKSHSWCSTICTSISLTSLNGFYELTMMSSSSLISLRSFYGASTRRKLNLSVSCDFTCHESLLTLCLVFSGEGQAGRGNNEEFGLLSLEFDENFCMGGPGIIMSRQTLKRGTKWNESF